MTIETMTTIYLSLLRLRDLSVGCYNSPTAPMKTIATKRIVRKGKLVARRASEKPFQQAVLEFNNIYQ